MKASFKNINENAKNEKPSNIILDIGTLTNAEKQWMKIKFLILYIHISEIDYSSQKK